ncbi:MAG: DUF697 domain-containing protein [Bacteroidota bacterium]
MTDHQSNNFKAAQSIIKRHVFFSTGAGFIPVPVLDIVAVSAIQIDMLRQLCKLYGQDFKDSKGKAFVGTLTGTTLSRVAAHSVGSVFKVIPFVGSIVGGVTTSAFAGAATYAIGQVVTQHFASGGSFDNFKVDDLKDFYKEQMEKGKEVVEEWKEEAENLKDEISEEMQETMEELFDNEVDARLAKLESLKEAGLVTETEYKRIKKRIMKDN